MKQLDIEDLCRLVIAKKSLDPNFDIDTPDENGNTTLHLAVGRTDSKEVHHLVTLLEAGASIHSRSDGGYTPLFYCKNVAVARLLLDNGARWNEKCDKGKTASDYIRTLAVVDYYSPHWRSQIDEETEELLRTADFIEAYGKGMDRKKAERRGCIWDLDV